MIFYQFNVGRNKAKREPTDFEKLVLFVIAIFKLGFMPSLVKFNKSFRIEWYLLSKHVQSLDSVTIYLELWKRCFLQTQDDSRWSYCYQSINCNIQILMTLLSIAMKSCWLSMILTDNKHSLFYCQKWILLWKKNTRK